LSRQESSTRMRRFFAGCMAPTIKGL
jgi:hypothetical protein